MLLAMIHAFLRARTIGQFELSLGLLGATEARIGLFLLNFLVLILGNTSLTLLLLGARISLFDLAGWLAALAFLAVLLPAIAKTLRFLDRKDKENN